MRKIYPLTGGIHPPENKTQSLQQGIGDLPLPEKLVVPLQQGIGTEAKPLVNIGDRVLKGQLIAEPEGLISTAVHAPTSGEVIAIGEHPVPHPSGLPQPCISIAADGNDQWIEHSGVADYLSVEPALLLQRIREAGIAGMGGAGFPTAVKLAPRSAIDTLIINATECEPYITADDILMQEAAAEIIEGVKILAHLLGNPQNILLGIEDNKPKACAVLAPLLKDSAIELVEFPTKYPSGGEKQLIQILTGKEVPSGGLPSDIGIVCQNVGTCQAVYRAVVHGEPLISRITTVTGEAFASNRNYRLLIGTPISHLLTHSGFDGESCTRLIMGGPMMGFAIIDTEAPIIKTTNCLLAPSAAELPAPPPAQACIRCGKCSEACPASLLPQQLFWHAQSKNYDKLQSHNLFDCIECGACSYVCPSSIPLVQYYRASKGEIIKQRKEKEKADHARQRFEFRKAREERIAADKAAKKEARRLAALAAKKETKTAAKPNPADDIIQAAIARAAAKRANETPADIQAKLERAVNGVENRLNVAEKKYQQLLQEGTAEQQEQALAKVESIKLKLQDSQQKLAQHIAEHSNPKTPEES